MDNKTVVVLGGEVGGSSVANDLRCRLGRKHDVLLVDKMGRHVFWPSLFWIQVGLREPKAITKDIGRLLRRGIDVVRGEVSCTDAATTCAKVDGKKIKADYLIVSLGADLAPGNVPGLDEAGHNLYSPEGSISKMALRSPTIFLAYILPKFCPRLSVRPARRGRRLEAVDRESMETRFPGVFAIGDNTSIPLEMGLPLPKTGVVAYHQAQAVARTIAARINGEGRDGTFDGHRVCFVEAGGGRAGFGGGDFYGRPLPQVKFHEPSRKWHMVKV